MPGVGCVPKLLASAGEGGRDNTYQTFSFAAALGGNIPARGSRKAEGKTLGGDKVKRRSWAGSEFQGALEAGILASVRLCEGRSSGRRISFPMPLSDRDPRAFPAHVLAVEEENGSG
ncbi:hypothetical protein D623_10011806 [Myotis brandtii]|uniref:Uncharacterized protein n=1 Tax=Myotis brandtii TaxID=109478 RepID=S7NR52_MYOBR|nr:hypothetical protein D623_10011806 [Myotis brandtii]